MTELAIVLLLFPVISAAVTYLLREKRGIVATAGSAISLCAAFYMVFTIHKGEPVTIELPGFPDMPFLLKMDTTAAVLAAVVALVSFFIFIYAKGYMADEKGKVWFWAGMSLFLAAMQLLVIAGDWILFVTGWEIMGFASYLLIGTWHWNASAQTGANKAFLLTRFTDLGLYLGAFVIIIALGTSEISATPAKDISLFGALALLVAVMGKSAQVPFQSWLSGAMAGPTPVSALLHSATMVAAGAILLFRAFPLLPDATMPWVGAVGGVTIILTGITAIASKDVKQMLAASTSSQLGFMLLAIGAGYPGAAFGHWIAHAFMKSSLFMGSGVFQHARESTAFVDIRGIRSKWPASFWSFAIAGIALSGIPPLIGYWSKDGILAAGVKTSPAFWYFSAAIIGALLTAIYIGRAIRILWKGAGKAENPIEKIDWMRVSLVVLVIAVIGGGFLLEHIVKFAEYEIPKSTIAKFSGIAAAIAGLGVGWILKPAGMLSGKSLNFLQNNYQLAGGFQGIIKPTLKVAYWCGRFDEAIHQTVLKFGSVFYSLSKGANAIDTGMHNLINFVGQLNLWFARITRRMDELGIEEGLEKLTASVSSLGSYGKKLQSGMVHKELLLSVSGMVILIVILIFSIL